MTRTRTLTMAFLTLTAGALAFAPLSRPDEPAVIKPGTPADMSKPTPPPSDATVLFDGRSLDNWQTMDKKPAPWGLADGAMVIRPGGASIITKETFGDCQLHVEFATPTDLSGASQERGNSGVYLQGRYEVQVLDSYNNKTYPDGQCGAVYGKHPPLVNACRGPGEWQTYDIIFRAARFDAAGKKTENARVTVLHNGVLIQNNAEIDGTTGSSPIKESAEPGPVYLQDHGNPVKYRNIWIRPL